MGTDADATTHGRPAESRPLSTRELELLYRFNDLARRIVDELVEDATKNGHTAYDRETNKPIDEPEGFDIGDHIVDAGISGRLYGGAHVLMVTDSTDYDFEIQPQEQLVNLVMLDRWEATPTEWTDDIRSPNYNKPEIYSVTPNGNAGASGVIDQDVHYSRLLTVGGNKLPKRLRQFNQGYDDSVLQSVWNTLRNFVQTEQAIANIIQRFETATISIAGLSEALAADDDNEQLALKRLRLLHKSLSMVNAALIDADAGEKYERKFATVNGLDTLWDRLAHSIAKAARQPMTQLFGMSPSGLSTDDQSGKANWRKEVSNYQDKQLRPELEKYYRFLNGGRPVDIEFPPLDETTPKEEAEIGKLKAETRAIYVSNAVYEPTEVREQLVDEGKLKQAAEPTNEIDLTEISLDADEVPEHVPEDKRDEW